MENVNKEKILRLKNVEKLEVNVKEMKIKIEEIKSNIVEIK